MKPIALLVTLLAALGTAASAQATAGDTTVLNRTARLDVHDVSLEVALQDLSRRSRVPIAFSPDLVTGSGRVSCSCLEVTVRQALDSLLSGTGLTYSELATHVVIGPRSGESPSAPPTGRRFGTLHGVVRAVPDGRAVAGALVRIAGRLGELRSDARGRFNLTLSPGAYDLVVLAVGYSPQRLRDVRIENGGETSVAIEMPRIAVRLRDIVITPGHYGVLDAAVASKEELTRDEIEVIPQLGEDVFRAVKRLPGIASDDISTRLNPRGATDQELLILLDGLELYEPYHLKDFDGALGIIDVHSLGSVELRTGGFPVRYGDKLAGVFDMTSRVPPITGTRTTLGLSITNASMMTQGGFAGGKGQWLFSARRGYLDLVLRMTGDDDNLSPRYYDVFGKVEYMLHPEHRMTVHTLHASDNLHLHDDGVDLGSRWKSSYGWLTWDAYPTAAVHGRTLAWAGRVTRHRLGQVENSDLYKGEEHFDIRDGRVFDFLGARHDLSVELSEIAVLQSGIEVKQVRADYEYYNTTQHGNRYDTTQVALQPEGHAVGAYVAARVRPVAPLTVEVGARYDHVSHTGDDDWAPRILAALDLSNSTSLRASWGLYYQSHGVHELEVGDGEVHFFPSERARQLAVGIDHRFGDDVSLRLEAYRRTIANPRPRFLNAERELAAFPEAEGDRTRIYPLRSRAQGIEFLVQKEFGRRWAWSASYALAVTEDEVDGRWVPRTLDQRHTLGIHSTYRPNTRWQLSWSWQFHTGWPATERTFHMDTLADGSVTYSTGFGALNAERLPDYHRLDLRLTRAFPLGRGVLQAYLDFFNTYGRTNLRSYDYVPTLHDDGTMTVSRRAGDSLLPCLPSIGFRYEF